LLLIDDIICHAELAFNFSSVKNISLLRTCPATAANAQDDLLLKMIFNFSRYKWLHFAGEVEKSETFICGIFARFRVQNIIKIGLF